MAEVLKQPDKYQVRHWMAERRAAATPLPSAEEIRRQLGFEMLYNNVSEAEVTTGRSDQA